MLSPKDKRELSTAAIFNEIAERLSPASRPMEDLTPAMQWKVRFDEAVEVGDNGQLQIIPDKWLAVKLEFLKTLERAPGTARYLPGPTQWMAHEALERTKQVVGGWRAGKSKWLAAELLTYMFKDGARIWNVANTFMLGRPEFEYVYQWLQWLRAPIEQTSMPLNGAWQVKLGWDALLITVSAEDVKTIEAGNLDAAGVAEAGQVEEDIIHRLRGRTTEKRGPVLMAGSLEDSLTWYLDDYVRHLNAGSNWRSFGIPSWENRIVYPGGREDPEIKELEATLPPDMFKLKVGAEVVRSPELVFPDFNPAIHVTDMEFKNLSPGDLNYGVPNPMLSDDRSRIEKWILPQFHPVDIAVDPGYAGAYAVLALQKHSDRIYVIDEVYARQTVATDVIEMCKDRWWWPRVQGGTIDIAGRQHLGQKSHHEMWAEYANLYLQSMYVPITDGIQRLKTVLQDPFDKKPRLYVHPNCKGLIREFDLYRYKSAKENRPEREEPIDANNHSIKALIYYLVNRYGFSGREARRVVAVKYIRPDRRWWDRKETENNLF